MVMNKKNQKKMEGKKTKRRKSSTGKRHGRAEPEEKPKSAEVMNEKEKQDRLEAANVLSSLMFFPPKSSAEQENTESEGKGDLVTPTSVTQLPVQLSTSGIPTTSRSTALVQGGGRGSPGSVTLSENATNIKNSMILAQLQSQLHLALKNRNVQPVFHAQPPAQTLLTHKVVRPSLSSKYVTNDKSDSQNVPLTVLKQNLTVNKNVAKALRQVVSNNKLKSETPQTESNDVKVTENSVTSASVPLPSSVSVAEDEHEKMDYESLPSSRKTGSSDTNLPLKKRRLIGMNDESLTTSDLNFSANLDTLASARQIENILQMAKDYPTAADSALSLVTGLSQPKFESAGEGYRPVQFDPRTSLMVLSDLKFALTPDEDGDLPIHIAVVHENTELVKKFIDIMAISGKTVDRFNKLQQTPLHLAVLVNSPEIVSVLLAAGANPNLLDRNGYTCVHISVNKGLKECMETLFRESKFPVDLNTRDYEGYYPLHTCVELDNLGMMTTLIEQGANKDSQDGKAGRSVLLYAVEYNRVPIVQYLLDEGATPDLQNYASVTPLMTAQAANMDAIVAYLSKALEIGNKYDDTYIPSKKVPISRIPSKHAQIVYKDMKIGRHSGDMPLIYQEYDPDSTSNTDDYKKEPLSRQSSVSSPIDLSMRHNNSESSQAPLEMSIRGKPGRRKSKKENKAHKEKQPQKSMLKEKHATVIAALERSMFANKSYPMKANGKAPDADYKQVEPHIKVEATESECVEMKEKDEKEETVDTATVRTKSSSEALSNFILNLKPDQTKYLVEKVKQQLSVHRSQNISLTGDDAQTDATNSQFDNKMNNLENSVEGDSEMMHHDGETDSVGDDKDKAGEELQDITSAANTDQYSEMDSDVIQNKMDDDSENRTENIAKKSIEDPVEGIQSQCHNREANNSEESDVEEIVMDHSPVDSDKDSLEQVVESPVDKTESEYKSIECPASTSLNETDKSCRVSHEEGMLNDISQLSESFDECIDKSGENVDGEESSDSVIKAGRRVQPSDMELVTQISQESTSSSPLQGSQGSDGFELISSPLINTNQVRKTGDTEREMEHSEDSMEVEFSGNTSVVKTIDHSETEIDVAVSDSGFERQFKSTIAADDKDEVDKTSVLEVDQKKSKTEMDQKKSKTSMDIDEDDEENGLVIDEHSSEDEVMKNGDRNDTTVKNKSKDLSGQTDSEKKVKTVNSSEDTENSVDDDISEDSAVKTRHLTEVEHSDDVVENDRIGQQVEEKGLRTSINEKMSIDSEKLVVSKGQDVSNSTHIGNAEVRSGISSKVSVSEGDSSEMETIAQRIKSTGKTVSEIKGGVSQGIASDELLKKGQSHTLYYLDGDNYKPVKIFIDNSEQSSLVLQRMFQTTQLSNATRQKGFVSPGDMKAESVRTLSEKLSSVAPTSTYTNDTLSYSIPTTSKSVMLNDLTAKVTEKSVNSNKTSSSHSIVETVSVINVRPSAVVSHTYAPEQSFQQAYIESLKDAVSIDTNDINGVAKQTKKQTIASDRDPGLRKKFISPSTKQRLVSMQIMSKSCDSGTSMDEQNQKFRTSITTSSPGKKITGAVNKPLNFLKYSSEGTLTRVNPDVKSKLSKALQSPQRKVGLVRSESDTYIVNNRSSVGNVVTSVSGTVNATVIDSRQQL